MSPKSPFGRSGGVFKRRQAFIAVILLVMPRPTILHELGIHVEVANENCRERAVVLVRASFLDDHTLLASESVERFFGSSTVFLTSFGSIEALQTDR